MPDEPEEDDPVVLMYTGGTTGLPKGVLLDQRAEMLNLLPHAWASSRSTPTQSTCTRRRCSTPPRWAAILGIPALGAASVFVPLFDPGKVHGPDRGPRRHLDGDGADHDRHAPRPSRASRPSGWPRCSMLTYGASPMPAALLEQLLGLYPDLEI